MNQAGKFGLSSHLAQVAYSVWDTSIIEKMLQKKLIKFK